MLDVVSRIPEGVWWSLQAFMDDVKSKIPDFLRPTGDYDSWYVRDVETNSYLRGFQHWDDVDRKLLLFFITGPMHWMGMVDLASKDEIGLKKAESISAIRVTRKAVRSRKVERQDAINKFIVRSDGHVNVSLSFPRSVRYQVGRFTTWLNQRDNVYQYLISPDSLERAVKQGLNVYQLFSILEKNPKAVG